MPSRRPPRRRSARSRAATCAAFHEILAPTVPLSRHIFKAPTRFYKTGVVFMAYLNGLQNHFTMIGGQESTRSTLASGRAVPAGRRRRPAGRSGARGAAHEARHGDARCALMRDLSQRPLAARDQLGDGEAVDPGAACRGLRARRHHGHRAVARHRAGRRRREGRQHDPRRGPDRVAAIAAPACFPPPTRPAAAPRSTTTAAPSTKPPPIGAR